MFDTAHTGVCGLCGRVWLVASGDGSAGAHHAITFLYFAYCKGPSEVATGMSARAAAGKSRRTTTHAPWPMAMRIDLRIRYDDARCGPQRAQHLPEAGLGQTGSHTLGEHVCQSVCYTPPHGVSDLLRGGNNAMHVSTYPRIPTYPRIHVSTYPRIHVSNVSTYTCIHVLLNNSNRGSMEQRVAEAPRGRGSARAVPRGACLTVRARRRGGECMRQG